MSKLETPEWADGAILYDGFEECLIGFGTQFSRPVAIYDYDKCIDKLIAEFTDSCAGQDGELGCDHWSEAEEYMEFNVTGGWVGENTPIFLRAHHEGL